MALKHIFLTQACTFIFCLAAAQENNLSFGFGPGHLARQDLTFSPFVHQDISLQNVFLGYQHKASWQHDIAVEIGAYAPILTDPYRYGDDAETFPHSFLLVDLTYSLCKPVFQARDSNRWVMGGFFKADIQPSYYNYNPFSSFGYFASFGLGVAAGYAYRFNEKDHLLCKAQIPLLALIARSPYLINDDEFIENTYSHNGVKTFFAYLADGKFQTLNRMQQLQLDIEYTRSINTWWDIGAAYSFQLLHADLPTNLLQFNNVLRFTTTFKL